MRLVRVGAWGTWALCLAFTLGMIATDLATTLARDEPPAIANWVFFTAFLSFPTVGAIIVTRMPRHRIGWLFCFAGLCWSGLVLLPENIAIYTLEASPEALPDGVYAGWVARWGWVLAIGITLVILPLLFPDGRLPSERWRWARRVALLGMALSLVGYAFGPGDLGLEGNLPGYANPLGVETLEAPLLVAGSLGMALLLGIAPISAAALIVRFRRSRGVERLQLKWSAYAAALVAIALSIDALTRLFGWQPRFMPAIVGLSIVSIPVAAGIAILRYRLYDIDRIINRTIVYVALSAILGLAYGCLVLLQHVLNPLAISSDLWVALSTLTVAAIFRPLRTRVQGVIDRRFYRSKYDAARTIEAFGARLRDELDLDTLQAELVAVIRQTMQPASVSVWFDNPAARGAPDRARSLLS
ncbi:MAG: hypothetical protein DCC58_14470 [Chloroflexi bacterium]|nr:MAG: hypothetical protein DCC58_14470 [Chloroflexota bacterium]